MQNQRNLMIQTWLIDQKPQIWASLDLIAQIRFKLIFFENRALSLFSTNQTLTRCKKSNKSYEQFLR